MRSRDPQSNRTKKRENGNFNGLSRPQRRSKRRLGVALGAYDAMTNKSNTGGKEYTRPGANNPW